MVKLVAANDGSELVVCTQAPDCSVNWPTLMPPVAVTPLTALMVNPPLVAVMSALMAMLLAAVSVSVLPPLHAIALATVMLPSCEPAEPDRPVVTTTLPEASAACSVATFSTESSADGV